MRQYADYEYTINGILCRVAKNLNGNWYWLIKHNNNWTTSLDQGDDWKLKRDCKKWLEIELKDLRYI